MNNAFMPALFRPTVYNAVMIIKPELTPKQSAVLEFFLQRATAGQPPPTFREIADRFGWKSATAAKVHVLALVRKKRLQAFGELGASRGFSLAEPVAYPTKLIHSFSKDDGTVDLSLSPFMVPAEGVLFAFLQPTNGLRGHRIHEGDMLFVSPTSCAATPSFPVVSVAGVPEAVLPTQVDGRRVKGVVATLVRSFVAEAMSSGE
jgi:hypothetical protein